MKNSYFANLLIKFYCLITEFSDQCYKQFKKNTNVEEHTERWVENAQLQYLYFTSPGYLKYSVESSQVPTFRKRLNYL